MPTPTVMPSSGPIDGVETAAGVTVVNVEDAVGLLVVGVGGDGGERVAGAVGQRRLRRPHLGGRVAPATSATAPATWAPAPSATVTSASSPSVTEISSGSTGRDVRGTVGGRQGHRCRGCRGGSTPRRPIRRRVVPAAARRGTPALPRPSLPLSRRTAPTPLYLTVTPSRRATDFVPVSTCGRHRRWSGCNERHLGAPGRAPGRWYRSPSLPARRATRAISSIGRAADS